MQRLSALDATFLEVEDAVSHMHIASVALFEGPPPPAEQLRSMVLGKLSLVPRYRQVVRRVPFAAGRPVWVDDRHFNLEYHVRRTALPAPGSEEQLKRLVGRVMSQQLDRTKPLWEMWVVEGLAMDGVEQPWALLSKVHHCMVDGISGADLLTVMLDLDPHPPAPTSEGWRPHSSPSSAELLLHSLLGDLLSPLEAVRSLRAPRALATRAGEAAHGLLQMRGVVEPSPTSSLNGPVGAHRRWSFARARLADAKNVKAVFGGTVNDVVLACITSGFRDLLKARDESVERVVRTLVPVSVRAPSERGTYNNRVSAIFAELPVGIADPIERLSSIREQMADLKASNEAVAGEVLTSLAGFAPPMLLALGERLATRVPQHNVNTVTTNVPGPQQPLYAAGRRMLEAFPYVPLGGHVRVGVAIFSYDGRLTFGVTGDYDTAQDIDRLCSGIERGMEELLQARDGVGPRSPRVTRRSSSAERRRSARSRLG
ncbi:MAG TPA: wax ester/triacylglycerol synthase family O-acyltransferase [Solirubrobacteraceae bacterium]|nr:wax ester/triacylglycerol synthase family O-acyltransferase [Solirubrobacteraceae bacterium]